MAANKNSNKKRKSNTCFDETDSPSHKKSKLGLPKIKQRVLVKDYTKNKTIQNKQQSQRTRITGLLPLNQRDRFIQTTIKQRIQLLQERTATLTNWSIVAVILPSYAKEPIVFGDPVATDWFLEKK
eukprot:358071_1